jgi:hypothetical protein
MYKYELHRVPRAAFAVWRSKSNASPQPAKTPAIQAVLAENLRKPAAYFDVRSGEFMGILMNIFCLVD